MRFLHRGINLYHETCCGTMTTSYWMIFDLVIDYAEIAIVIVAVYVRTDFERARIRAQTISPPITRFWRRRTTSG
jgi:hypothetical protein